MINDNFKAKDLDIILSESLADSDHEKYIVEIEMQGDVEEFTKLINHIKGLGGIGHSFNIIVDPDADKPYIGSWDGDGIDKIGDIKINGEVLEFD